MCFVPEAESNPDSFRPRAQGQSDRNSFLPRNRRESLSSQISSRRRFGKAFGAKKPGARNPSKPYMQNSVSGGLLKMSKSILLECLSDKSLLEINLIQFVNPSIYCYDTFLNSLIFISKFHRGNMLMQSQRKRPARKDSMRGKNHLNGGPDQRTSTARST